MHQFLSGLKKLVWTLLFFGLISSLGYVLINYYSVIFSKHVSGKVLGVERIEMPIAVITRPGQNPPTQIFSFAVAIQDEKTNEIFTASSEDRQWAIVTKGQCVEAEFLPYPPWNLAKKDTYYGARLTKLYECNK